jgi:hypothetical protein
VVQEDALLREGHSKYGNKWTEIAKMVGGRYTMILSGSLPTLHGDLCMQCAFEDCGSFTQLMKEHCILDTMHQHN